MTEHNPVIFETEYSDDGIHSLDHINDEKQRHLLLDFPTVYVIGARGQKQGIMLYVGETTDIQQRTIQHLVVDPINSSEWQQIDAGHDQRMIVIGHEHFNKSLTLDIENKLMLYLSGAETTVKLMNLRTNPQGQYYPKNERDQIFSQIWRKLHAINSTVFPLEKIVQDSALFKASPFHTLTKSQKRAKELIISRVVAALKTKSQGQLIIVEGEAGSGKTVLLSSVFYELMTHVDRSGNVQGLVGATQRVNAKLMVNHDQQLKVYKQIMLKLGLYSANGDQVGKPTHFINEHEPSNPPIDVILVDEAHLLYTQGKQAYQGKNQLNDLLQMARVVIAILDPNQVLAANGYRTREDFKQLETQAERRNNLVKLTDQLRMQADPQTLSWLDSFIFDHTIQPLPIADKKQFDLQVFSSPNGLEKAIRRKATDESSGLSRLVATFDWPYTDKRRPDEDSNKMWLVKIGSWSLPWNLQVPPASKQRRHANASLAWAEQPQTINEVGSTFTVQGFDLNYVGVILGPSVGYENGKIVSHPEKSANANFTNKRTLADGQKVSVANELLQNELNVLMTRGVHGLYIYAVDPALRAALLAAEQSSETKALKVAEEPTNYE